MTGSRRGQQVVQRREERAVSERQWGERGGVVLCYDRIGLTLRDRVGDVRSSLPRVILPSHQTDLAWRGDVGNSSHPYVSAYDLALHNLHAGQ